MEVDGRQNNEKLQVRIKGGRNGVGVSKRKTKWKVGSEKEKGTV